MLSYIIKSTKQGHAFICIIFQASWTYFLVLSSFFYSFWYLVDKFLSLSGRAFVPIVPIACMPMLTRCDLQLTRCALQLTQCDQQLTQCALQPMQCVYFIYMIVCNLKKYIVSQSARVYVWNIRYPKKSFKMMLPWATVLIWMVCISNKLRSRPLYIIV